MRKPATWTILPRVSRTSKHNKTVFNSRVGGSEKDQSMFHQDLVSVNLFWV